MAHLSSLYHSLGRPGYQRRNGEYFLSRSLDCRTQCQSSVDSAVTLVFHYHCKVELTARVDSVVIHQSVEAADTGGLGGFGLKFQESLDQIQPKLQPLIEKLGGESFPAQDLGT